MDAHKMINTLVKSSNDIALVLYPYSRRGIMLDPARHFIKVPQIKKQIDGLAMNKLNTLHLHLSDGESVSIDTTDWLDFANISDWLNPLSLLLA